MSSSITEALLQCELFGNLSAEEVEPIAGLCQVWQHEVGETIFRQGDRGNKIYIIVDGQVTLERSVNLGDRKAKVKIAILGRGRAFGCWSALLGDAHNLLSSATCTEKAGVVSVEGPALRAALKNNLPVGFKVMERLAHILGDRLRGVYGAMEKL